MKKMAGCLSILLCSQCLASKLPLADPLASCRLPEMGIRRDVGLGFPRIPFRLKTSGDVNFAVLFVDFSDVPATQSPQEVMQIIYPEAERFFHTVSYGKLNLHLVPRYKWIRMDRPSNRYHNRNNDTFAAHREYLQEAIDHAGADFDFANTDAILVLANPTVAAIDYGPGFSPTPGFGVVAGGRVIENGATSGSDLVRLGWRWFVHEVGHTMSLVDLAGPLPGTQNWHTYVGDFSAMGDPSGTAPGYLGWERWQLGWLEDHQVICANRSTMQVSLSPIERPGGTKLLVVPTGPRSAIVVESRRAEGYDSSMPKSGPLVYTVDTGLSSHEGAIRVQPVDPDHPHHLNAPMTVGQTITVGNVSVTALSSDSNGDTVRIATFK